MFNDCCEFGFVYFDLDFWFEIFCCVGVFYGDLVFVWFDYLNVLGDFVFRINLIDDLVMMKFFVMKF